VAFTGFSADGLRFLAGLAANNDKAWFDANRVAYDDGLIEPARELVVDVGERLAAFVPDINAEPRVNGSIFRINRDLRFSKDRRPYKEHLDLMWWRGAGRSRERPGFFFRLTPATLLLGAGMHRFAPDAAARAKSAPPPPDTPGYEVGRDGGLHAFVSVPAPPELTERFAALAPFCEHVRRIIDDTP
jgi:uncharacterized protein (DUF2461 family)